jgi:hypothetical protein
MSDTVSTGLVKGRVSLMCRKHVAPDMGMFQRQGPAPQLFTLGGEGNRGTYVSTRQNYLEQRPAGEPLASVRPVPVARDKHPGSRSPRRGGSSRCVHERTRWGHPRREERPRYRAVRVLSPAICVAFAQFGGTRNGMAVSWPGHIKGVGGLRSQFCHVTVIRTVTVNIR